MRVSAVSSLLAAAVAASSLCGCADAVPASESAELGEGGPDPSYMVFGSRDEALAWFEPLKPFLAGLFGPVGAVVADDDPRVAKVGAVVARHWEPITKAFAPAIPQPRILLVENEVPNGAALFDQRAGVMVDVLVVGTALLGAGDEALDAILAHELGHLVMRNIDPEVSEALTKYYAVSGKLEPLGIDQPDDPAARSIVAPYMLGVANYGSYALPELNGLPLGVSVASQFFAVYFGQEFDPARPACQATAAQLDSFNTAAMAASFVGDSMIATPEQLAVLDTSSLAIESTAAECLQPPPGASLVEVMAKAFAVTPEVVLASPMGSDLAGIRSKEEDAVTALFSLTRKARAQMRATQTAHDLTRFRQYTNEEQADDFAMTILFAEGADPRIMGSAVVGIAGVAAACDATLATGEVPFYGLVDTHHSHCYRAYHARAFAKHLEEGGAGVTGAARARAASPALSRKRATPAEVIAND